MFEFRRRRQVLVVLLNFIVATLTITWLVVYMHVDHTKTNMLDKRIRNFNTESYFVKKPLHIHDVTRQQEFDVEAEMQKLNKEKVDAADPRLVSIIRKYFIVPPSEMPYNLTNASKLDTSAGQATFVDSRLGFKEGGFYVESGAHDGEYLSNTLFLERERHWDGVLIEPLPEVFKMLQYKHRKAHCLKACLSLHKYPSNSFLLTYLRCLLLNQSTEYMTNTPVLGRIVGSYERYSTDKVVQAQCFPLYSILLALNRTDIDFLSLDVEGIEHNVLETIPWNKVNIKMLAIEYDKWPGGINALCKYMENKGYECAKNIKARGAADTMFVKRE